MNTGWYSWYRRSGRRWLGRCGSILLAASLAVIAEPIFARGAGLGGVTVSGVRSLDQLRFPAGSSHAWLADQLWLHNQPTRVLVFDVPTPARELIRALTEQQPALMDLNVMPGLLLLSGRVGDERWVVQMQTLIDSKSEATGHRKSGGRTVGSIASVPLTSSIGAPSPAWLPTGSRLRLDVAVKDAGVTVSEHIWQHVLPPAQLATELEAGLQREGWRRQSVAGAMQWWGLNDRRMQILLVPLETGSGLHVRGWAP